jgi:hypothetical protein
VSDDRGGPVRNSAQRPCDETDGLKRFLFNIEFRAKPVEADIEATGGFEKKAGTTIQPNPYAREQSRVEPKSRDAVSQTEGQYFKAVRWKVRQRTEMTLKAGCRT